MDKDMTSPPARPPFKTHRGKRGGTPRPEGVPTKDWPAITLKVADFPKATTTEDLYTHFSGRGTLVNIIITDDDLHRAALLTYMPVPPDFLKNKERKPIMERLLVGQGHHPVNVQQMRWAPELINNPRTQDKIPGKVMLRPDMLQFGLITKPNEMTPRRGLKRFGSTDLSVNFDLKHSRVEMGFSYQVENPRDGSTEATGGSRGLDSIRHYKLQLRLNHIDKIFSIQYSHDRIAILIIVRSPPLVFKRRDDIGDTHLAHTLQWSEIKAWQRVTDLMYDTNWLKETKTALVKADQDIDIGRWLAYQVYIPKQENRFWGRLLGILKDFNVDIVETSSSTISPTGFVTLPVTAPGLQGFLDPHATPRGASAALFDDEDWHLPFAVRYQLEVCISQGLLVEDTITKEFLTNLSQLARTHRYLSNPAADLLTYVSDEGQVVYDPMHTFRDKRALMYRPYFRLPEYCEWVRKVIVTPTTMYMSTPIPETTNRVLRQYRKYADRFLRVQFTEEKTLGKLYEDTETGKKAALFDRIDRTLKNGIEVAGRHYQFLAFGNSQFRELGAYFFHPTSDLTCDHIRSWMGDFSHIKVVAKFAARMGQCLSTTRTVHNLPAGADVKTIPDIEKNGWCFTDGVGKVAIQLAGHIADSLGMYDQGAVPSAFQFRLGGSKGLLVAWPSSTNGPLQLPLKFNQLHLRSSQMKFRAGSKSIEIVKGSSFSIATLNRQTITILRSLGVADQVFVEMAKQQDREYRKALEDEETALGLLQRHSDPNGTNEILAVMVRSGFMRKKEPSMMALLSSWLAWCLKQLKEKARLVVEQGAFLFGCVDETHTLRGWYSSDHQKPDSRLPQIFVQVPEDAGSGEYVVKTGICVVGRNPSLHPGDLRVVEAVDIPELRHIRNVVVFPAKGDRDIPSMCSGGDLDGDDYFVIWDPRLLPTQRSARPMVDEVSEPLELQRDVQISDIQDFFVEHIKNNTLSMIAQSHLAHADMYGARNEKCIQLASLHSKAVDYIKSGQPARLTPDLRTRRWPHFMDKPWGHNYHSKTALGQIYDSVQNMQVNNLEYLDIFDLDILQRFDLEEEELLTARALKMQYDCTLARIMAQQEMETEFELFTTFALTRSKLGSDYKRHEEVGSLRSTLHERCIATAVREAGPKEGRLFKRFVAACYRVTWEHVCLAKSQESTMPFITFPWVFYRELCHIATNPDNSGEVEATAEETDLIDLGDDVAGVQTENAASVETETETKNLQPVKLEPSGVWDRDITHVLDRFSKADGSRPEQPEQPEQQQVPLGLLVDIDVDSEVDVKGEEDHIEVEEPASKVGEPDFKVQEADSRVQEADSKVEEVDFKVAEAGFEVKEADFEVEEVDLKVDLRVEDVKMEADVEVEEADIEGEDVKMEAGAKVEENSEQQAPLALLDMDIDENPEQPLIDLINLEVDENLEQQVPSVLIDFGVDADNNNEQQPPSVLIDFGVDADNNNEQQPPSVLVNVEVAAPPKHSHLAALLEAFQ